MAQEPQAAVALIECLEGPERCVLVLRRASHPQDPWSGQLAFPGGRREQTDPDLLGTAIRETAEECGIQLQSSDMVSALPIATAGRSNGRLTLVQPFHFRLAHKPSIVLDFSEMASAHWLQVSDFLNPANHTRGPVLPNLEMPCLMLDGIPLWGFTYGVMQRFYCPDVVRW